jgi:hypothetical protein
MLYQLNPWTALEYTVPSVMQGQQIYMKHRTVRSWSLFATSEKNLKTKKLLTVHPAISAIFSIVLLLS